MMEERPLLILASGSPRRREILHTAGIAHRVLVTDTDETIPGTFSPERTVLELSLRKAEAALRACTETCPFVILAADTVVAARENGRETILGKPGTPERAGAMLRLLSGNEHRVLTGITLTDGSLTVSDVVSTTVLMRRISEEEIDRYVAGGSPLDKAGAYGVQEHAGLFVRGIVGDYYNVVGLPLCRTGELLSAFFGFRF